MMAGRGEERKIREGGEGRGERGRGDGGGVFVFSFEILPA